jgi:hypothetical protein
MAPEPDERLHRESIESGRFGCQLIWQSDRLKIGQRQNQYTGILLEDINKIPIEKIEF